MHPGEGGEAGVQQPQASLALCIALCILVITYMVWRWRSCRQQPAMHPGGLGEAGVQQPPAASVALCITLCILVITYMGWWWRSRRQQPGCNREVVGTNRGEGVGTSSGQVLKTCRGEVVDTSGETAQTMMISGEAVEGEQEAEQEPGYQVLTIMFQHLAPTELLVLLTHNELVALIRTTKWLSAAVLNRTCSLQLLRGRLDPPRALRPLLTSLTLHAGVPGRAGFGRMCPANIRTLQLQLQQLPRLKTLKLIDRWFTAKVQQQVDPRRAVTALECHGCYPCLAHALALVDPSQLRSLTVGTYSVLEEAISSLQQLLPQLPALQRVRLQSTAHYGRAHHGPTSSRAVRSLFDHAPLEEAVVQTCDWSATYRRTPHNPCSWEVLEMDTHVHTAATLASFDLASIQRCIVNGRLCIDQEAVLGQLASQFRTQEGQPRPVLVCKAAPAAWLSSLLWFTRTAFQIEWDGRWQPAASQHLPLLITECCRHLVGTLVLANIRITPGVLASLAASPNITKLGFKRCVFDDGLGGRLQQLPAHVTGVVFFGDYCHGGGGSSHNRCL